MTSQWKFTHPLSGTNSSLSLKSRNSSLVTNEILYHFHPEFNKKQQFSSSTSINGEKWFLFKATISLNCFCIVFIWLYKDSHSSTGKNLRICLIVFLPTFDSNLLLVACILFSSVYVEILNILSHARCFFLYTIKINMEGLQTWKIWTNT